ncbi:MAG TPA: lysylphosphatidylglycerol synthase domain-containing protein [Candidatus Saccharimonadales bacterium]|nr:lysylphosphatidylglycerol synthase domain-containing protein [Candidatus Saccharimonadales bacterium]
MNSKTVRSALALTVLIATLVAFTYYFQTHPEVWRSLQTVPLSRLGILFVLYVAFMGSLVWIQRATLALCDLRLHPKESTLLVMYSSVINFFGPLQSGPAFRAAYLKTRHNLSLKRYTVATLAYYGLYAVFSGLLLMAALIGLWILPALVLVLVAIPLLRRIRRFKDLDAGNLRSLAAATLSQVLVTSVIYLVEIHSLMPTVSYVQALVYTGAANFALFVSVTPGAIGFRESFLLFSQRLHDIGGSTIAAASVIDRSVYILLLLVLAAIVFGLHANDCLKVKQPAKVSKNPRS